MITVEQLKKIANARSTDKNMSLIADAFNEHAYKYGVFHQKDIADCLAHISVETGGFRYLTENMNYSVDGLMKTFSRARISRNECLKYGRSKNKKADQQGIANAVYGGSWGKKNLGNTEPNDGWDYRGRGPGQATGRANYERAKNITGIDFITNPSLMALPHYGMEATLALWQEWDMNKYQGGSNESRRKWNGGSHGLRAYKNAYQRAMRLKLEVPKPTPVLADNSIQNENVRAVVEDAAAVDRVSKEKPLSIAMGTVGSVQSIRETVSALEESKTMVDSLIEIGPWFVIVFIAGWWFWRRYNKAKAARAVL